MRLHLELGEGESKRDVNALSFANAVLKFANETNEFANNSECVDDYLFIEDIANALLIVANSRKEFYRELKEQQNDL
jgi:hypothetical protein